MRRSATVWTILLGVAAAAPGCAPAQPPTPEALVKRMSDRLATAQAFSFSTRETHQRRRGDQVLDLERARSFVVKRPGAIAFTGAGEKGQANATYDGKHITLVWPDQRAYARVKMPGTIDATLERLAEHFNMALPVGDLLYSNAYEALISPDSTGRYVGRETLDGALCDHVAFTQPRVDWELWVAAAGAPTPCRIRITTKGKSGPLTSEVSFAGWNLAATPAADAFEAKVPADYERIMVAAFDEGGTESPAAATPAAAKP